MECGTTTASGWSHVPWGAESLWLRPPAPHHWALACGDWMGGSRFASMFLAISGFLSRQPKLGQGPPAPLMGICQTTRDGVKHILDVGTARVLPDTREGSLRPWPIPVSSDGRFWRRWSLVGGGGRSKSGPPAPGPVLQEGHLGEEQPLGATHPGYGGARLPQAGLSGPLLTAVWLLGNSQPLNQFSSFV